MNIKTEEQQIADRLASIIERVNKSSAGDSIVNLHYATKPFRNTKVKEGDTLILNKVNIECLKNVLEAYQDIVDIAYGNKLLISYSQYKKNKDYEKREAQRLFDEVKKPQN